MVDKFRREDAAEVSLVVKLLKHTGGSSSRGVGEVNGVAEIDDKGECVYYYEEPLTDFVVDRSLFDEQGKEHHQDIEHVGIDNGCAVEHQSSSEHTA